MHNTKPPGVHREPSKSNSEPSKSTSDSSNIGVSNSATPSARRAVVGPSFRPTVFPKRDDPAVSGSGRTLDWGDLIWVPPVAQSGDGKTNLNSKYYF